MPLFLDDTGIYGNTTKTLPAPAPLGFVLSGSSVMQVGNGTAVAPSIAFTNSPTSGMFRKAADSVGFSAAGVEIGFYTGAGVWTFGPVAKFAGVTSGSLANGFFFNGPIRIDTSSVSQIRSSSSGGTLEFVNEGSGFVAGFAFYSQNRVLSLGGTDGTGAWTFGQNIDYTNANRIDTRLNGGLAFRYPISNSIAHRIFVDDGSSIASGQVPLVLQSSYTGAGLNRSFSLHSGAVSGTTNEIAYGLHGGQWSFGRLVTSEYINHEFNGQTINLKGHLSKSSNGVVADFNMTTNRIDNSNNDMRAISRLIGNATPGSRSWDLICFEAPSSYRTLRLQPDGGPVIIGSGGGGERALIYGRLLVGPTAANSSDNSSGLLQTSSTTDNLIHVSLHRGGHTSVNHTISGNSYNIVNSSAGVQLAIGGTGWAGISDIRLKKDVVSLNHGLSEILQIETIRFNYIADAIERPSRIGFSAQNLLGIVPEAVSGTQESMFCVTPTELIPILVKAVQELKSELDVAKARIAVLESAT